MEKKHSDILLILIAIMILLTAILLAANINRSLDNPDTCNLCHEMTPYVFSYLKPENGSAIAMHNLTCIECHANISLREARAAVLREIELSVLAKTTGIKLYATFPALNVNCTRCHAMDSHHPNVIGITDCLDCHWAHRQHKSLKAINTSTVPVIPYGPHRDQSCQKCHGTTFQIPRCINCHTGHGEQKLENNLCLGCHIDPHDPKKPGIRSDNTVKFAGNLPFSTCQPCHENEYYELTNSGSLHTEMKTCIQCHQSHGEKPKCNGCHPVMEKQKHPDFQCNNCHKSFNPIKVTCQDCHGGSHEWSASTAIWNPK